IILLIAFAVIYIVYFLFTFNQPLDKQVSDTKFILGSFAGGPNKNCEQPVGFMDIKICFNSDPLLLRKVADLDIIMAGNKITQPFAQYLLGVLMVLQRSEGGNTGYFMGQVSASGSPLYFPTVYALKEPLPILILVFVAFLISFGKTVKRIFKEKSRVVKYFFSEYLGLSFAEFAMISFVVFYWLYSINSPLNIGFRHIFPTLPFLYILSAGVWKKVFLKINLEGKSGLKAVLSIIKIALWSSFEVFLLCVLVLWFLLETAISTPYFLSYFNELGGGTQNGYHYVADSNYDWGQDLLRLKDFVDSHPEIDKIAVDYFGGGNPKYYMGDASSGGKVEYWWSSKGNPSTGSGQVPPIHWFAISINNLQNSIQPMAPGQQRREQDSY
ncbi:MAG: hypothetical protein ACHQVK_03560, partial [Candidatus Paceibacterales bacterium]